MPGWHHYGAFKPKQCVSCEQDFEPTSGGSKFCSKECATTFRKLKKKGSTESQYLKISGNWKRYFSRLAAKSNRKKITRDDLLMIWEKQNGLCALTGQELTCYLERGKKFLTNASIDRIDAGGEYTIDNIQLVCSAVNQWRGETPLTEFKIWCKKVTEWQEKNVT